MTIRYHVSWWGPEYKLAMYQCRVRKFDYAKHAEMHHDHHDNRTDN